MSMRSLKCPSCGAPLFSADAQYCQYCGIGVQEKKEEKSFGIGSVKSRTVAVFLSVLSLIFGGIAFQCLYIRSFGLFILSFLMPIGYLISFIHLFSFLSMSDEEFESKYRQV